MGEIIDALTDISGCCEHVRSCGSRLTGEVDAIEERWLYKRVDYRLGKLSSVNAPDFSICDTGASDSSPLALPVPGRFLPHLDRGRKPRSFFAAYRMVWTKRDEETGSEQY
jgi:hypothetical protein